MVNKKVRVLFLVSSLEVGNGVSSFAMNYFRDINHDKVDIDFLMYFDRESPYCEEVKNLGSNVYLAPKLYKLITHFKFCYNILKSGNYDIVHDNTLIVSVITMIIAKLMNIKVRILHSHSSSLGETVWKKIRNYFFLTILKWSATHFVACSKLAGKAMFGKEKFIVLQNVVNADKFKFDFKIREHIKKEMNVQDKVVIATVGRCSVEKNPFFAIDIIKSILIQRSDIEYWWIGNGPLYEELKQNISESNIDKNIKLLGERKDVAQLYQAVDCFFMPSLFEGLPVTGIEAQANGIPIVASSTITNEMVISDLVEFVSLDEDKDIWVNRILAVLNKKINRSEYSRQFKLNEYSDVGCGKKLLNIYSDMLYK